MVETLSSIHGNSEPGLREYREAEQKTGHLEVGWRTDRLWRPPVSTAGAVCQSPRMSFTDPGLLGCIGTSLYVAGLEAPKFTRLLLDLYGHIYARGNGFTNSSTSISTFVIPCLFGAVRRRNGAL